MGDIRGQQVGQVRGAVEQGVSSLFDASRKRQILAGRTEMVARTIQPSHKATRGLQAMAQVAPAGHESGLLACHLTKPIIH
jgi:hypothetical protein